LEENKGNEEENVEYNLHNRKYKWNEGNVGEKMK
jgi:hypothetical protein